MAHRNGCAKRSYRPDATDRRKETILAGSSADAVRHIASWALPGTSSGICEEARSARLRGAG
jgi:hypothetical protein